LQGNLPAPQISTPSKQDSTLNNILAKSTLTPEEYEKITQELLHRVSETPVKEPRQPSQPFPFSTPASAKKPMAVHSTPVTTIDVGKLIMDKSSPARSKMIQQQHQAKKQLPKFSDTFKVTGSAFNLPLPPQPEVSVTPWDSVADSFATTTSRYALCIHSCTSIQDSSALFNSATDSFTIGGCFEHAEDQLERF
jgi:hypothetical protein